MKLQHVFVIIVASAMSACGGRDAIAPPQCSVALPSYAVVATTTPSRFDSLFEAAANEFGVSAAQLKSIGYVETRWQMITGGEEFEGRPAAYGVMALRGSRLTEGAARAGVTIASAKSGAAANIRAAAALLAAHGLEYFSGIENVEAREAYVRDVGAAQGLPVAYAATPDCTIPTATVDFSTSIWHASPNFNSRPTDGTGGVQMIIIHTCEGAYSGCWGWLVNTASQVSAHYVINENGSEVSQLVREKDRAWHIAARYDCALNAQYACGLNNVQSNNFTVGIEHGGYAAQDSFPTAQLEKSARLVCDITKRNGIPRDSLHIVGHGQLQPNNRTDPGSHWPWHRYISMIRTFCGDPG